MGEDLRTWDAWRDIHQPFELDWWRTALAEGHSSDQWFLDHWAPVKAFIEPKGKILDIGCGPRPPFAPCTVIEPLALDYYKITPWQWWRGVTVIPFRAEVLIEDLRGAADTVICWNCLDHTIGWPLILDNMLAYGTEDARFAVATDFSEPFVGHPGYPREAFEREIDARFKIEKKREDFRHALALLMKRR
jgi:hypothetical protein